MKQIGIVRDIDKLGRIVIPVEVRRELRLKEGTPVEIFLEGENIILRRYKFHGCQICGETRQLAEVQGTKLCKNCLHKFQEILKDGN